jgi:ABC-type dipeptide/oligopeptide/nickel transport system ATPase subunit
MPSFDIVRKNRPSNSFRTANVIGQFDISPANYDEHFVGEITLPTDWSVGVIFGNSGTGKTTIAKELFTNNYITQFEYTADNILDNMPKNSDIKTITKIFNSVGFSSPPSWLKPYNVLSNGEKMRVDLARAILEENELIVFDEFTSVVDRNIAKIGSYAVQKAVRKSNKQFIAVSCHEDIIEWLEPDWVFNTNTMQMAQKKTTNDQKLHWTYTESKGTGIFLANIII